MKTLQQIILEEKNECLHMSDILIESAEKNKSISCTFDIDKIQACLQSVYLNNYFNIIQIIIKNKESFQKDKTFKFFKDNLPKKNVSIEEIDSTDDIIFKIENKVIVVLLTIHQWNLIQKHRGQHTLSDISLLKTIYEISEQMPIKLINKLTVDDVLSKTCLATYKPLHAYRNQTCPTILSVEEKESHRIYKLKDYPKCILEKLNINSTNEILNSLYLNYFVNILIVSHLVKNNFECESKDKDGKYYVTLNWKEGTFITNEDYKNRIDLELILDTSGPLFISRWSSAEMYSVINKDTNQIIYSNDVLKFSNDSTRSEREIKFICKLLSTHDWFDEIVDIKYYKTQNFADQVRFTSKLYKKLFKIENVAVLYDDDSRTFEEQFTDFTYMQKGSDNLYIHWGFINYNENKFILKTSTPEMFAEFYLNDNQQAYSAILDGFLLHMTHVLYEFK